MRKYIVGFFVGALAFTAVQASADGIKSLVNTKVGSVWELHVNGENVGEVPIISGSSYAPVRQIAEIAGMDVDFEQGKVFLTSNKGQTAVEYELSIKKQELETAKTVKVNTEKELKGHEKTYADLLAYDPNVSEAEKQVFEKRRQQLMGEITELEAEIKTLESEIATLEAELVE